MFVLKILFPLLFFISCNQIKYNEKDIVARVGDKSINRIDFLVQYSNFLEKSGVNDNILFRNKFIDQEINRLIILSLADSIDVNESLYLSQKVESIKNQTILDEYFAREVLGKYQPEDAILRDVFIRSKTDLHARHIYAESLESANQLKVQLEKGTSFEKLAQTIFRDSVLAENGGDLGYFSFGDMDPAFEDVAFSLNDGEVSDPVKTRFGYSIIQVLDRWIQPLITENDFQLRKNKLTNILRIRNRKLIKESFTDSMKNKIDFSISEFLLNQLFINYETILSGGEHKFQNIWISSSIGRWNIYDLVEKLRNLSSLQQRSIREEHDLLEALKGILLREKILIMAKNQDWFFQTKFQNQLVRRGEDEMIDYLVNNKFSIKGANFQENYEVLIENSKQDVPIYINKKLIKSLRLSS